jgi:hypothetical protein
LFTIWRFLPLVIFKKANCISLRAPVRKATGGGEEKWGGITGGVPVFLPRQAPAVYVLAPAMSLN